MKSQITKLKLPQKAASALQLKVMVVGIKWEEKGRDIAKEAKSWKIQLTKML